jgi:hypothetical protein
MNDDELKVTLKMLNYTYQVSFDDIIIYLFDGSDPFLISLLDDNKFKWITYHFSYNVPIIKVYLKRKLQIGDIIQVKIYDN